jgi:hypothetical protein
VRVMTEAAFGTREKRGLDTASSTRDERLGDGAARSEIHAAALGQR